MLKEYYDIFRRNFPFIVREDQAVYEILGDPENKAFESRNDKGELIGISLINKNSIYMLCVDEKYRRHGIGAELLKNSEAYILERGYDTVILGVGDNYLMPGIPMRTKPYNEALKQDQIYPEVKDDASVFFQKRGYQHSWKAANCFDMRADLDKVDFPEHTIGDTMDGIRYRWATLKDRLNIMKCTDDAYKSFTGYYTDESLYTPDGNQKVLIAEHAGDVCGTLIVGIETEGKGLGSIGCTAVSHNYRGKHIAVNMAILGTKYIKTIGLKKGYLGYTYSGLDKLYSHAGYLICVYYNMAQKQLV